MESHFVKLEPPYQIIHYGGVVGIQIGTLIVVGKQYPGPDGIDIYTHSHPVVSYVDKHQLKAKLGKNRGNFFTASYFGGGEGNVWSKVEVSDVDVIGLWDTDQEQDTCTFEWDYFAELVYGGFSYMDAKKGTYRNNGIFDLYNYLRRVGLTPVPPPPPTYQLEIGLCLRCIKHKDGLVSKFIQCVELNYMDRNRPITISFYAMYNEKHIDLVSEIIRHHMTQFLSLLQMRDADIKFVTFDDEDINEDDLVENPEDIKNLEIVVNQLNDIYNKTVRK